MMGRGFWIGILSGVMVWIIGSFLMKYLEPMMGTGQSQMAAFLLVFGALAIFLVATGKWKAIMEVVRG